MRSFAHRVCVHVRVCVCERERKRQSHSGVSCLNHGLCVCVCVCVWVRERERERERDRVTVESAVLITACVCVCVCVCVCERERERETGSHHSGVYSASEIVLIAACLQTHMSFITVSVTWLCSPLRLELMLKLRTLLTVFTFILKVEAHDYGKGRYISNAAFGVGQSQCTVPVGQSEQTVLVGRRGFVENEAFERGGA